VSNPMTKVSHGTMLDIPVAFPSSGPRLFFFDLCLPGFRFFEATT